MATVEKPNECLENIITIEDGIIRLRVVYRFLKQIIDAIENFNKTVKNDTIINDIGKLIVEFKKVNTSFCTINKRFYYTYYKGKSGPAKMTYQECQDPDQILSSKECFIKYIFDHIPVISPTNDTNRITLINNNDFIIVFYEFIWTFYRLYALHTMNLQPMNEYIKKRINEITKDPQYCIIMCRDNNNYTCGRAILPNTINANPVNKIIIFNTISEHNDEMDIDQFMKYTDVKKGGYIYKYLKYKQKYLTLKKSI